MLRQLRIQNLVLIQDATLNFQEGLNILTGETGSGKSAIMHALSLALGQRSDSSLIRKGCERACVEAVFDDDRQAVKACLSDAGIDHEDGEDLIIRRELFQSGKGKIFINHQATQLSFLRQLSKLLVQSVGQHATQSLFNLETHRGMVDLFGGISPRLEQFRKDYDHEKKLASTLEKMIFQDSERARSIETYRRELKEIEEADIKKGEEEELFSEYTLLSNAEEISQKIFEVNQALSGDSHPLLTSLNRQKQTLESLAGFDASLSEVSESFQSALIELQEAARSLQAYQGRLFSDPDRLRSIDQRLVLINQLKRKYGSSDEAILAYLGEATAALQALENADSEIEELKERLGQAVKATNQSSLELKGQRERAASALEEKITAELQSLNMPNAMFTIQCSDQPRTREGDDRIEFFLRPNLGEHVIPLKEGASGGEMSRVLLALHTLLAGKEEQATLIFDEIDANIGGETAAIIAQKLLVISKQHQIICITHFPQVAVQADHHFEIAKQESEGRTLTIVKELKGDDRKKELARMAGDAQSVISSLC